MPNLSHFPESYRGKLSTGSYNQLYKFRGSILYFHLYFHCILLSLSRTSTHKINLCESLNRNLDYNIIILEKKSSKYAVILCLATGV